MEYVSERAIERLRAAVARYRRRALCTAAAAFLALALSPPVRAQNVEGFFDQYCAACHTVGSGPLIGPDLKGVTARQERGWLVRFILDPDDVIASGDPYASRLVEESGGIVMPHVPGLTPQLAEALLDLVEARSGGSTPPAVAVQPSEEPPSPEEIEHGRSLFFGEATLSARGTACFSCHTLQEATALGGGRLAPDLSQVYVRLKGRKALSSWLSMPPTPTMQAVYAQRALTPDEVRALVALFESQAPQGVAERWEKAAQFLLVSASGTALVLVAIGGVWRRRFRAVRRPLVHEGGHTGGARWR